MRAVDRSVGVGIVPWRRYLGQILPRGAGPDGGTEHANCNLHRTGGGYEEGGKGDHDTPSEIEPTGGGDGTGKAAPSHGALRALTV